jgi:hypothetical protein
MYKKNESNDLRFPIFTPGIERPEQLSPLDKGFLQLFFVLTLFSFSPVISSFVKIVCTKERLKTPLRFGKTTV